MNVPDEYTDILKAIVRHADKQGLFDNDKDILLLIGLRNFIESQSAPQKPQQLSLFYEEYFL